MGLQDAPRQRKMDGQDGSTWKGTKVYIIDGSIYQLIGEGIWVETRIIIKKWLQRVTSGEPLGYKEL